MKIHETNYIATILTIYVTCLMDRTGQMSTFQCVHNTGSIPSLKSLMNSSTEETIWQFSLTACALLCEKKACISYSYDPVTKQCSTRNVNTEFSGYLCGIAVDLARQRCQLRGEAYVAFGGKPSTPIECVCGTEKTNINWIKYNTSSYDCIDICTERPCVVKLGFSEPCVICKGDANFCNPRYNRDNFCVSICAPIV